MLYPLCRNLLRIFAITTWTQWELNFFLGGGGGGKENILLKPRPFLNPFGFSHCAPVLQDKGLMIWIHDSVAK